MGITDINKESYHLLAEINDLSPESNSYKLVQQSTRI